MIKEEFNLENCELLYYTGESQNIIIPNGVKSIGKSAFEGCENIKSIIIPEGVTKIGDYAFG
ncbi:MAG: leucine-rich repeat protein [Bacilli bacterium]